MVLSGSMLLNMLIQLVVGSLVLYVLFWFIGYVAPPEPIRKVAVVLIALVAVVWLINILMGIGGHPIVRFSG